MSRRPTRAQHRNKKTPADLKRLNDDIKRLIEADNIYNNRVPIHLRGPNAFAPRHSTQERYHAPPERHVFVPSDSGFDRHLEAQKLAQIAEYERKKLKNDIDAKRLRLQNDITSAKEQTDMSNELAALTLHAQTVDMNLKKQQTRNKHIQERKSELQKAELAQIEHEYEKSRYETLRGGLDIEGMMLDARRRGYHKATAEHYRSLSENMTKLNNDMMSGAIDKEAAETRFNHLADYLQMRGLTEAVERKERDIQQLQRKYYDESFYYVTKYDLVKADLDKMMADQERIEQESHETVLKQPRDQPMKIEPLPPFHIVGGVGVQPEVPRNDVAVQNQMVLPESGAWAT